MLTTFCAVMPSRVRLYRLFVYQGIILCTMIPVMLLYIAVDIAVPCDSSTTVFFSSHDNPHREESSLLIGSKCIMTAVRELLLTVRAI